MIAMSFLYLALVLAVFTVLAAVAAVLDWRHTIQVKKQARLHHRRTLANLHRAGLL